MGFDDQGKWTYVQRKKHAGGRNWESRDRLERDHRFNGVQDDVARVAVSFFVTNLLKSLQIGELWKRCAKIGIVVDVFISPKLSKTGRRYGFVRFIRIKDKKEVEKKLCEIWIGSYHLFAALATKRMGTKRVSAEYIPRSRGQPPDDRNFVESRGKSYVTAVRGEKMNRVVHHREEKVITIEKKELTGLTEVENTVLAENVFSRFKNIDSEFIVKDRMVWLEIYGLPMCAWNPCVFKRVAALWGEVLFTDDDESNSLASGEEGSFFEVDNDSKKSSEEHYGEEASEEGEFVPNLFNVGNKDGFEDMEQEVQHESLVKKSQEEAKAEKTLSFPTVDAHQCPNNTPPFQFHYNGDAPTPVEGGDAPGGFRGSSS
ncbi:hypothetical protein LXL04_001425 [Taraxacum kok-saghyz]